MTSLLHLFNTASTLFFGALFAPFGALDALWPMLLISIAAGALMLWIFGKTSNQSAVRLVRDRIRGNLIGVRLFQHDALVLLRLQGRILRDTLVYMRHSLVPLLVMILPAIWIMTQLNLRFTSRPLAPGERTVLKVKVRDAAALGGPIALEASEGVEVETPPVRIASLREAAWRVRVDSPGRHRVTVVLGEERLEKSLAAGGGWAAVSARRTGAGPLDALLYPGEPPIAPASAIESIEVNYDSASIRLFGLNWNWIVFFFVFSLIFGFLFKGPMGVEI